MLVKDLLHKFALADHNSEVVFRGPKGRRFKFVSAQNEEIRAEPAMNNEDRELLELAAKAAGFALVPFEDIPILDIAGQPYWNPLIDDGDALRLVVNLHLTVDCDGVLPETIVYRMPYEPSRRIRAVEPHDKDSDAATRRAIVRAAAQIGKQIKYLAQS